MGTQVFSEVQPHLTGVKFVNADGTAAKTVGGDSALQTRVDTLLCQNTDTIPHVINVGVNIGGTIYQLGSVSVAAGAGTAGTPCVDLLAAIFPATQVGMQLMASQQLEVSMVVAVVATFTVTVVAVGGYI